MNAVVEKKQEDRSVVYVPLGEKSEVKLTVAIVQKFLVVPTRSGHYPTDQDVMKFIMLCKARELNPWVGDAYLIGYDSKDGPQFSLITSVQALFKRAENHPEFDGLESGVIVRAKGSKDHPPGPVEYREGDFFLDDEELLGGWARVYRKDREKPFFEAVKLSTFKRNTRIWDSNTEGMLSKTAESGALRKAFPNQLGGLYLREEIDAHAALSVEDKPRVASDLKTLTEQIKERKALPVVQSSGEVTESAETPQVDKDVEEVAAKSPELFEESTKFVSDEEGDEEPSEVYADFWELIHKAENATALGSIERSVKKSEGLEPDEKKALVALCKRKAAQHG